MSQAKLADQVLEFTLGEETYCVTIDHVNEIVSNEHDFTEIPNSPRHIEGITDLRGRTATVINPKTVLGLQPDRTPKNIVIFEAEGEESYIGWLVDDVSQVTEIADENVDDSVDEEYVKGIVRRNGDFIVWIDPEIIND